MAGRMEAACARVSLALLLLCTLCAGTAASGRTLQGYSSQLRHGQHHAPAAEVGCEYGTLPGRWLGVNTSSTDGNAGVPGHGGGAQEASSSDSTAGDYGSDDGSVGSSSQGGAVADGQAAPGRAPRARWEVLAPGCAAPDLLSGHLAAPDQATQQAERLRVLLVGDSVDAHLVERVCEAAAPAAGARYQKMNCTRPDGRENWHMQTCLVLCSLPTLELGAHISVGVHLDGPWHILEQGDPLSRASSALAHFVEATDGMPDVVGFASAMWDLGRLWNHVPGVLNVDELPADILQGFIHNTTILMDHIQELAHQETMLVYHTAAFPATATRDNPGFAYGGRPHVAQLNAGGRAAVLQRPEWHPLDFEAMTAAFTTPQAYLSDDHHPAAFFLQQAFNLILAQHQQHRAQLQHQRDHEHEPAEPHSEGPGDHHKHRGEKGRKEGDKGADRRHEYERRQAGEGPERVHSLRKRALQATTLPAAKARVRHM